MLKRLFLDEKMSGQYELVSPTFKDTPKRIHHTEEVEEYIFSTSDRQDLSLDNLLGEVVEAAFSPTLWTGYGKILKFHVCGADFPIKSYSYFALVIIPGAKFFDLYKFLWHTMEREQVNAENAGGLKKLLESRIMNDYA